MLKILGISRSTYYYRKHYRVEEKKVSGGRPAPGYSYHKKGNKISDEQIKEMILEELEGDAYNYGYRKITAVLRYKYDLIINLDPTPLDMYADEVIHGKKISELLKSWDRFIQESE